MKKVFSMFFASILMFILVGCKNKMIDKYNVTLYSDINNSLNNTFVKEHITKGSHYEGVLYDDENISKEYTILVNSQVEANNIFTEIPFIIDFEKQNILIYIFTTNYYSAKVEITNAKLDNNIFSFYIKERLGGIGTGSATIPTTRFIVLIIDKIENCNYSFIIK